MLSSPHPSENLSVRGHDARSRVMEAAGVLFRQKGFSRTSIDMIAAAAHMSKRTLYAEFPNKISILEAVLDAFIAARFSAIERLRADVVDDREALLVIVREIKNAAIDDDAMAMHRLLISEAAFLPALSDTAHRHGVSQSVALMRRSLEGLGVHDYHMVGRLIYELAVLAPLYRRLMGACEDDLPAEVIIEMLLAGGVAAKASLY